ncbi:hypothetical protein SALBM311S_02635 [Streptomyces alboniger]
MATGVPVVLVLLTGRPYALGGWHSRLAAVVQAFFPGEEGGPAVAGVLSGHVNPSGRLPVSVPHVPGGQPWTSLQPPLGLRDEVANLDPTPLYPFGHGRSYTTFVWEDFTGGGEAAEIGTDGSYDISLTIRNTGDRAGVEVVQLYLHDPVASVTRPDVRLVGYQRLELAPGEASPAPPSASTRTCRRSPTARGAGSSSRARWNCAWRPPARRCGTRQG